MYLCLTVCSPVYIHVETDRPMLKYLLQLLSTLCFEQVLSLNLEPTVSARLASQ